MNAKLLTLAVATLLLAAASTAQVPAENPRVIALPPLTITGTTLQANVTYDPARRVYRYEYTLSVPATAAAPVKSFFIDISGRVARAQTDTDLQNNYYVRFPGRQIQPNTTIPVGIVLADPATTSAGLTVLGNVFFAFEESTIPPGGSRGGFVLESKFPPAERKVEIRPDDSGWYTIVDGYQDSTEDIVFEPKDAGKFDIRTTTIAPSDPDLSNLFNGGGQSPAEVNPFLRYVTPTDTRTSLPAGATSAWVTVVYGDTTDAATFTATFNGVDVRSRFHPAPGAIESVKFDLAPGTSKVQLSIQGRTSSGRMARDTDTLTFLVP